MRNPETNKILRSWGKESRRIEGEITASSVPDIDPIKSMLQANIDPAPIVSNILIQIAEVIASEKTHHFVGSRTIAALLGVKRLIEDTAEEVIPGSRTQKVEDLPGFDEAVALLERKIYKDLDCRDLSATEPYAFDHNKVTDLKCYSLLKNVLERNQISSIKINNHD